MPVLDKKGYRISIAYWVGNLGNHLIQMSGALNVAEKTQSSLTVPEHPLLKRRSFDFTDRANDNCGEPVVGRFFSKSDCFQFPVSYDSDRRRLFRTYLHDLLLERTVRQRLGDLLHRRAAEQVRPGTLVINMRSGRDIFRSDPPPQNDYMQPPLSFYKHVITAHGYTDCLIVTEADRENPCIDALLAWNADIRIKKHRGVRDDLMTILAARHLVLCHSTFSWCLALMSRNLQTLFQPATFQIRGVGDLSVYTYSFDNFIKPGEWTASEEQLEQMVSHSVDDIKVQHEPRAATGEAREPVPSNFW